MGGVAVALGGQYLLDKYDLGSSGGDFGVVPTSATMAVSEAPELPRPSGPPKAPDDAQEVRVTWVYDGDTIQVQADGPGKHVNIGAKIDVRLIGVDAPELKPEPECYGQVSTDFLKNLLPVGTPILIAPDRDSWDDYERRLFYVWRKKDGLFVEYEIVSTGHAPTIRVWPNVSYYGLLERASSDAIKAERGLWGVC